jgi:hypothetical protein
MLGYYARSRAGDRRMLLGASKRPVSHTTTRPSAAKRACGTGARRTKALVRLDAHGGVLGLRHTRAMRQVRAARVIALPIEAAASATRIQTAGPVPERKPARLVPDFRFDTSASSNLASTGLGGCPSSALSRAREVADEMPVRQRTQVCAGPSRAWLLRAYCSCGRARRAWPVQRRRRSAARGDLERRALAALHQYEQCADRPGDGRSFGKGAADRRRRRTAAARPERARRQARAVLPQSLAEQHSPGRASRAWSAVPFCCIGKSLSGLCPSVPRRV